MCGKAVSRSSREEAEGIRQGPAKRDGEGGGPPPEALRTGAAGAWGERRFVRRRTPGPADVRDAHLRLDQQGLIDVLNDRFVLRRSVAECAFLRLMGIGARAPAACRQQRGKQDEQVQRQEKASFHGLSARLNMNRVSLILYRRSRFGSRENGKKME